MIFLCCVFHKRDSLFFKRLIYELLNFLDKDTKMIVRLSSGKDNLSIHFVFCEGCLLNQIKSLPLKDTGPVVTCGECRHHLFMFRYCQATGTGPGDWDWGWGWGWEMGMGNGNGK